MARSGDGCQGCPAQIAKAPGQSRLLCNHALSQAVMKLEQRMTTGGGGFLMMVAPDPQAAAALRAALSQEPVGRGAFVP
jgi:pyrrolidone-carboxylate peptidase